MSAETLRGAAAKIREDCPIPEASRALDFCDYPAAWALQNEGGTAHDERCSATRTGGAMLCDCEALLPPWVKWRTLLAAADWLEFEAALVADPKNQAEISPPALAVARCYLGES